MLTEKRNGLVITCDGHSHGGCSHSPSFGRSFLKRQVPFQTDGDCLGGDEFVAQNDAEVWNGAGANRGLHGAAQAAEQAGDRAKAKRYYAQLVKVAGKGDARPELAAANSLRSSSRQDFRSGSNSSIALPSGSSS